MTRLAKRQPTTDDILALMRDGRERTLDDIRHRVGGSVPAVEEMLRALCKAKEIAVDYIKVQPVVTVYRAAAKRGQA